MQLRHRSTLLDGMTQVTCSVQKWNSAPMTIATASPGHSRQRADEVHHGLLAHTLGALRAGQRACCSGIGNAALEALVVQLSRVGILVLLSPSVPCTSALAVPEPNMAPRMPTPRHMIGSVTAAIARVRDFMPRFVSAMSVPK